MSIAPFGVAVALTVVHFLGEVVSNRIEEWHAELVSLGAGLMVGTFFLEIMPQLGVGATALGHFTYLALLVGFLIVHLLEKTAYQHAPSEARIAIDTTWFEVAGLVVYQFVVGIIIVLFFEAYGDLALVLILPFFVRTFANSVSSSHINEKVRGRVNHLAQAVTPLVGASVGTALIASEMQLYMVFSTSMGVLLYIIVRDMIPMGRAGKPLYFVVGVAINVALFLLA
jgi:hypothetical protein